MFVMFRYNLYLINFLLLFHQIPAKNFDCSGCRGCIGDSNVCSGCIDDSRGNPHCFTFPFYSFYTYLPCQSYPNSCTNDQIVDSNVPGALDSTTQNILLTPDATGSGSNTFYAYDPVTVAWAACTFPAFSNSASCFLYYYPYGINDGSNPSGGDFAFSGSNPSGTSLSGNGIDSPPFFDGTPLQIASPSIFYDWRVAEEQLFHPCSQDLDCFGPDWVCEDNSNSQPNRYGYCGCTSNQGCPEGWRCVGLLECGEHCDNVGGIDNMICYPDPNAGNRACNYLGYVNPTPGHADWITLSSSGYTNVGNSQDPPSSAECVCFDYFAGVACEYDTCADVACSGHGTCTSEIAYGNETFLNPTLIPAGWQFNWTVYRTYTGSNNDDLNYCTGRDAIGHINPGNCNTGSGSIAIGALQHPQCLCEYGYEDHDVIVNTAFQTYSPPVLTTQACLVNSLICGPGTYETVTGCHCTGNNYVDAHNPSLHSDPISPQSYQIYITGTGLESVSPTQVGGLFCFGNCSQVKCSGNGICFQGDGLYNTDCQCNPGWVTYPALSQCSTPGQCSTEGTEGGYCTCFESSTVDNIAGGYGIRCNAPFQNGAICGGHGTMQLTTNPNGWKCNCDPNYEIDTASGSCVPGCPVSTLFSLNTDNGFYTSPCGGPRRGTCQPLEGGGHACVCNNGWCGKDCSFGVCPIVKGAPCSGQGVCELSTGNCICNQNFVGYNCEIALTDCSQSQVIASSPALSEYNFPPLDTLQYSFYPNNPEPFFFSSCTISSEP